MKWFSAEWLGDVWNLQRVQPAVCSIASIRLWDYKSQVTGAKQSINLKGGNHINLQYPLCSA